MEIPAEVRRQVRAARCLQKPNPLRSLRVSSPVPQGMGENSKDIQHAPICDEDQSLRMKVRRTIKLEKPRPLKIMRTENRRSTGEDSTDLKPENVQQTSWKGNQSEGRITPSTTPQWNTQSNQPGNMQTYLPQNIQMASQPSHVQGNSESQTMHQSNQSSNGPLMSHTKQTPSQPCQVQGTSQSFRSQIGSQVVHLNNPNVCWLVNQANTFQIGQSASAQNSQFESRTNQNSLTSQLAGNFQQSKTHSTQITSNFNTSQNFLHGQQTEPRSNQYPASSQITNSFQTTQKVLPSPQIGSWTNVYPWSSQMAGTFQNSQIYSTQMPKNFQTLQAFSPVNALSNQYSQNGMNQAYPQQVLFVGAPAYTQVAQIKREKMQTGEDTNIFSGSQCQQISMSSKGAAEEDRCVSPVMQSPPEYINQIGSPINKIHPSSVLISGPSSFSRSKLSSQQSEDSGLGDVSLSSRDSPLFSKKQTQKNMEEEWQEMEDTKPFSFSDDMMKYTSHYINQSQPLSCTTINTNVPDQPTSRSRSRRTRRKKNKQLTIAESLNQQFPKGSTTNGVALGGSSSGSDATQQDSLSANRVVSVHDSRTTCLSNAAGDSFGKKNIFNIQVTVTNEVNPSVNNGKKLQSVTSMVSQPTIVTPAKQTGSFENLENGASAQEHTFASVSQSEIDKTKGKDLRKSARKETSNWAAGFIKSVLHNNNKINNMKSLEEEKSTLTQASQPAGLLPSAKKSTIFRRIDSKFENDSKNADVEPLSEAEKRTLPQASQHKLVLPSVKKSSIFRRIDSKFDDESRSRNADDGPHFMAEKGPIPPGLDPTAKKSTILRCIDVENICTTRPKELNSGTKREQVPQLRSVVTKVVKSGSVDNRKYFYDEDPQSETGYESKSKPSMPNNLTSAQEPVTKIRSTVTKVVKCEIADKMKALSDDRLQSGGRLVNATLNKINSQTCGYEVDYGSDEFMNCHRWDEEIYYSDDELELEFENMKISSNRDDRSVTDEGSQAGDLDTGTARDGQGTDERLVSRKSSRPQSTEPMSELSGLVVTLIRQPICPTTLLDEQRHIEETMAGGYFSAKMRRKLFRHLSCNAEQITARCL